MKKVPWHSNPNAVLSTNLYQIMDQRKINAKEISDDSLTVNQISSIKNGNSKEIGLIQLLRLCQRLKIHPNDLLNGEFQNVWNNQDPITDKVISLFARSIRLGNISSINIQEVSQGYLFSHCDYFELNQISRIENIHIIGERKRNKNTRRMTLNDLIHYSHVFNVTPELVMDELILFIKSNC